MDFCPCPAAPHSDLFADCTLPGAFSHCASAGDRGIPVLSEGRKRTGQRAQGTFLHPFAQNPDVAGCRGRSCNRRRCLSEFIWKPACHPGYTWGGKRGLFRSGGGDSPWTWRNGSGDQCAVHGTVCRPAGFYPQQKNEYGQSLYSAGHSDRHGNQLSFFSTGITGEICCGSAGCLAGDYVLADGEFFRSDGAVPDLRCPLHSLRHPFVVFVALSSQCALSSGG